jgi:putative ABC transport system permease protein
MSEDKNRKTPKLAVWLLKLVARPDDYYFALGDLDQIYSSILRDRTRLAARFWIWWEIIRSLPGFARNSLYWSTVMLGNYLKITWRNARRQTGYFVIKIAGLAVGLACSLMIMLWVQHELSFDTYHSKADRIYRSCLDIQIGSPMKFPASSPPMGPVMVEEFPEVLASVSFTNRNRTAITTGDRQFFEDRAAYSQNSLFEIFDLPLVLGDRSKALTEPYTVTISRSAADRFFGDLHPIGQTLRFEGADDYTVTGVFEDFPSNSHINYHVIRSFETLVMTMPDWANDWSNFYLVTYLLLEKGADYRELEKKMPGFIERNFGDLKSQGVGHMAIYFQPLKDIYLRSGFSQDYNIAGNVTYVYGFTAIAFFILLIACVNFVNLTTARSVNRAREVGLRKALGADRSKLVGQFLCEAVLYCLLALVMALILVELVLPVFNDLARVRVSLNMQTHPEMLLALLGGAVLIGLLAGTYPALYLSAFNPTRTLKHTQLSRRSGANIRSVLVVFQFCISIILIIGTLTVFGQISYMKNRNLGFIGEQVLVIPAANIHLSGDSRSFLNELGEIAGVTAVNSSSCVPGKTMLRSFYWPEGSSDDDSQLMSTVWTDEHFLTTLSIPLIQGRYFSPDMPTDATEAIVINEAAARQMGWDNPIGKIVRTVAPGAQNPNSIKRVIGVIGDYHQYSLQNPIEPLVVFFRESGNSAVSLKLTSTLLPRTLENIERVWKEFHPERPFDYYFLDEDFDTQYRKEVRLSKIVLYFCLLAVFIGCLGLFGMASYAAEQRTREIGIRKVLGASTTGVVTLLARQFLSLVATANIVAWPVAYFLMDRWLENFAYHTKLGVGVFAGSGLLAILAALGTVSYQAIRAASANPVDSLKCE